MIDKNIDFLNIPDSGERHEFSTGAKRDIQEGKGRYDLISPLAIRRLAQRLEGGKIKYGERNWEKGIPMNSFIDSAKRHIDNYIIKRILNEPMDEDHLGAALWNIHCAIHTEEMIAIGKLSDALDFK